MLRRSLCLALLLGAACPAAAQTPGEPIRLSLRPAPVPSPALKYVLLPEVQDLAPGNGVILYYRAFSPEWYYWRQPGFTKKLDDYLQMPIKDLPRKEIEWVVSSKQLEELDLAARREYVDWEFTERLRKEGIGMLLPDIQSFRELAKLIALRARLELADKHYDKAVHGLQTGFALGRALGDAPLLISALVGNAVGTTMLTQIEEFIQAPDAPNLYWALTGLPRPFLSLRKPLEGEKLWLFAEMPVLKDIETARLDAQQQHAALQQLRRLVSLVEDRRLDWSQDFRILTLMTRAYPEAKRSLIARGRKSEDVEALPSLQVVLIAALQQYRQLQDDLFKWSHLPYWEARPGMDQAEKALQRVRDRLEAAPLSALLPAIIKVHTATSRLDRRIAALRCVEAIRLYAAGHDGKLPATLSEITEVPIPIDPMTGKSFAYKVDGDVATLHAPPAIGDAPADRTNTLTYELTVKR